MAMFVSGCERTTVSRAGWRISDCEEETDDVLTE